MVTKKKKKVARKGSKELAKALTGIKRQVRGARKGPKKVLRLEDLKPGMNIVGRGVEVPKEMKLAFSMYLAKGKRAFDLRGAPANPFSVGHVILDLIAAFSAYYQAYDGIPAEIAETIIINSVGEHLAHAHMHEDPPLPGEDKEARARVVRERGAAVDDPELGGKPEVGPGSTNRGTLKKRLH